MIKKLFLLDLGLEGDNHVQLAKIFAKDAVGLKAGPMIWQNPAHNRPLAVVLETTRQGKNVRILTSTWVTADSDGNLSHGFWESGTPEEWGDWRNLKRTPIRDEIRSLRELKRQARADLALVEILDEGKVKLLIDQSWSPAWLKRPPAGPRRERTL